MSSQVRPVCLHPGDQAQALGEALSRHGFTTEVLRSGGHQQHPCVVVTSGPARVIPVAEYVYAGPDQAGQWLFWLSCSQQDPLDLEPVAPISDVSVTADHLARTLTAARVHGRQASLRTGT